MSGDKKSIRSCIINLHQQNKSQIEIVRLLNIGKSVVSKAIKRFKGLGNISDRPQSGRSRTANTPYIRKILRDRIRRNSRRSMRKMATEIGISEFSVRNVVKNELQLKSLKLKKGQHLDEKKCRTRMERCRSLLHERGAQFHRKVLFSDEKFFSIEQAHNVQNDRILAPNSSAANKTGRIVTRTQKPAGVMIWAGVSFSGKTDLIFVEQGIKINAQNYVSDILQSVVMPWGQKTYPDQQWVFQQDSAPAHRAKLTQNFCKVNLPGFISSQERPPYSPDLNPLDYAIWGILEARACGKCHKSVESLKRDLVKAWNQIDEKTVRASIDQFPQRLRACINANGGYFENDFV